MTENYTRLLLDHYSPQLRWVCDSIQNAFDIPEDDMPDWRQEARLYVLCYAGILRWPTDNGRHFGLINSWKTSGVRDIKAMLATQLRLDLSEAVNRSIKKKLPSTSLNDLIEDQEFDLEDPTSEADMHNEEQANRLRRKYPELAMQALEGMTIEQIMEQTDRSKRMVMYRIAGQKRSFLTDTLRRANLIVEGDETMDELEEAYRYVTKARR